MMRLVAPLILALLLAACGSTLTNRATVYPVVAGSVDLAWAPTLEGVRAVEFTLDDKIAGTDNDATDGFSVEFDTTKQANGLHLLGIFPEGQDGAILARLEHTILIQN